jgi:hypothetical protein
LLPAISPRVQHAAVEAGDLDGRRAFWNFQRLDRGQMRADPDHDADHRDPRPQAEHRAPIEQPCDHAAGAGFGFAFAAAAAGLRLSFAWRVVVRVGRFALRSWFLRLVVGDRHAILRAETQFGQ